MNSHLSDSWFVSKDVNGIDELTGIKSHALSVSLTHFDAISRFHADTSIPYALTPFSKVTLRFKLSKVLMNSEFAPSLPLNFG